MYSIKQAGEKYRCKCDQVQNNSFVFSQKSEDRWVLICGVAVVMVTKQPLSVNYMTCNG